VLDAAGRSAREHGLQFAGVLPKPFSGHDVRRLLDRCLDVDAATSTAGSAEPFDDPDIDFEMLKDALEQRQFFLEYQPKVHCSDGSLAGVEALVRWRHPSRGVISPAVFIPLFEGSELTSRLTREIIDMALEWFAGLDCPSESETPITLSINISARSLEDEQLVERIAYQCRKHGLEHGRLIFELTETSAMQDPVRSLELLTRMRVNGFQLSLDDFGTGFSSMLQLVRLPFSEIKVDKSFVISAEFSEESRTVVQSIVELGKSLGLRVSAEGIETQWSLDFLRSIGCDYAQGYLISRPVSGELFRERWKF
jgi:EAL domain-containing protein (putative c-di-GMP-specific phosphodiesterase class I)